MSIKWWLFKLPNSGRRISAKIDRAQRSKVSGFNTQILYSSSQHVHKTPQQVWSCTSCT